jgi:hypothetical protein
VCAHASCFTRCFTAALADAELLQTLSHVAARISMSAATRL